MIDIMITKTLKKSQHNSNLHDNKNLLESISNIQCLIQMKQHINHDQLSEEPSIPLALYSM